MARDFNAKNIIVGAATFYVGPSGVEVSRVSITSSGATLQDPTAMASANGQSGSAWYHLGYTQNGVTLNIEPTYGEVVVDQLLDVARLFKSSQRVTVATSLTETTLENLYVAIGGKTGASGDYAFTANAVNQSLVASADGASTGRAGFTGTGASAHFDGAGASVSGSVVAALDINGGALGYSPIERSVCFVGPSPASLTTTNSPRSERIYIGYRAVSMDPVGIAVQRDNATLFPVNFRLLPSENNPAADGNAAYGKIIDRVY